MKSHIWKVFSFGGWFITLIGILFGLLYTTLYFGQNIYTAIFLIVSGGLLIVVGEYLFGQPKQDKYKFIWLAASIAGAFSLVIGLIWLVIALFEFAESRWGTTSGIFAIILPILLFLALGVALILVGEKLKVKTKKK